MSSIIAQARNYSPNMQTQKKANLAWRRLAHLLRPLLQVIPAPRNWMRTPSAFLPAQCTCTPEEPFPRRERSGKIIPANSSYGRRSLSTAISKMVTRLVRHYDQEERQQSDASDHCDTTRPKLLNAFAKQRSTRFLRRRLASTHP